MSDSTQIEQRVGAASRVTAAAITTAIVAAIFLVAVSFVAVVVPSGAVHADDGELRPRLEAACARIPDATTRLQAAIDRLDGPASQRGSLAWFEAAIERATANDRPRIAADLERRLDRLTTRRATLDERSAQLARLADRCGDLGAPA
jgi:hypothetical protein